MAKGIVSWEPGDDICPPYWPRWWGKVGWPPKPPKWLQKEEQIHLTLAIRDLAGLLKDKSVSKQITALAETALQAQVKSLGR